MPTYEYECNKCGTHFNKLQEMSDEPLDKCPECGGKVRRLLGTGAGIIFKGSGFYATDYKHTHASPSISPNSGGKRESCDRSTPCCGRGEPCDKSSCES